MKDLLGQRDALARRKVEIEGLRKEEERAREEVRMKARERVLRDGVGALFGKRKEREESKADGVCYFYGCIARIINQTRNRGRTSKQET